MAAKLIVAPEALEDIDEAYGWYERQRSGLGEAFLKEVDASIRAIRKTPRMHALIYENYRRRLLRRFPYARRQSSSGARTDRDSARRSLCCAVGQ